MICVNHRQQDTLAARGIPLAKTFVSMNVPDPSIFPDSEMSSCHRKAPRATRDVNLVYHGTMASRLGVDLTIQAIGRLRERFPNLYLNLWGWGDDLPRFLAEAERLGLADRIVFNTKGFPLEEIPKQLRAMDIGVVGNRRSLATDLMLPVKLVEYVAMGIPVIAPRLKTIEHYFTDDMLTFFEPDDVDSLAGAIAVLCCNPSLRALRAKNATAFLRKYGWDKQGPELVAFYRNLVNC